ncbi:MAG TPA: VanW family protein [Polyangiaceae bacterium]|nr:VanW family protein [Polyangiaceae bacterium]
MGWLSATGGAAAVLGLGAFVAFGPRAPVRMTVGDGEYLVSSPEDPRLAEAVRLRSRALLTATVTVQADDEIRRVPVAELGYSVDQAAFLEEARATVRLTQTDEPSSWSQRLVQALVRRPRHAAVFIPLELDLEQARRSFVRLAREIDRKPMDAELSIAEHKVYPSEPGRRLRVESSLVRLSQLALERDVVFEADVEPLQPQVTEADLLPVDVSRVLATYETSFRGKAGSRAVNIRSAARYLDGAVILPGEQLSFNSRVGRRIHGRGFVDAPVIVNDELEQDVGGGVCQVATTLHAAALFGNLRVVSRRSHSRPSGYAPLGLDATVIDGEVDLKIQNPYDEPLLVHAWVNGPFSVRVEILGRTANAKVTHAYTVTRREPFARRIWFKESVADGSFERKQKGSEGMDVTSVVKVRHSDGHEEHRSYHSKYYPVPEVFWVGKRVDNAALPELPEGAAGVVVDGQEVGGAPEARAPQPTDVPSLDEADSSGHRG